MWILHQQAPTDLKKESGDDTLTPLYVYDNVGLQRNASHHRMGIDRNLHVVTPTHSPDFNKPIEHCFNQIKQKLLNKLNAECDVECTPEIAQEWVAEAFYSIKTESLQADINSLKDTWAIVKARKDEVVTTTKGEEINGSDGDYIASSSYS